MKKFLRVCFILLLTSMPVFCSAETTLMVIGDSLSAGYGVTTETRWVNLLEQQLNAHCGPIRVVNASISGDTSQGGRSRLPALLEKHRPTIVIIELGGNDGLRGIESRAMRDNLQQMVRLSKQSGAAVLLLGVRLPANYGPEFTQAFHQVYYDVAASESVPLVPFFLQGVALDSSMMQSDGIHPNDQAQPILKANAWGGLKRLLEKTGFTDSSCLEE